VARLTYGGEELSVYPQMLLKDVRKLVEEKSGVRLEWVVLQDGTAVNLDEFAFKAGQQYRGVVERVPAPREYKTALISPGFSVCVENVMQRSRWILGWPVVGFGAGVVFSVTSGRPDWRNNNREEDLQLKATLGLKFSAHRVFLRSCIVRDCHW
jgi:hypothetical protein